MEVQLRQKGCLSGELVVPGDKSISHRSLILGALAQGKTEIQGLLIGEDCLSTLGCLRAMGLEHTPVNSESFLLTGVGLDGFSESAAVLDSGNSGTTIRLLLGILAGQSFHSVITGDDSLRRRPMDRVAVPLRQMGAKILGRDGGRYAPLSVTGGNLQAISYQTPVASAQVKSAILLAGLYAEGVTAVKEPSISRDHTERMLGGFGARVERQGEMVSVLGRPRLQAQKVVIPGDISSAAFFLVAGTVVPGSKLLIKNVGLNPTRTGILDALTAMGASIAIIDRGEIAGEPVGDVSVEYGELRGITIDGQMIPRLVDEIPVLAVAATQATGTTIIRDAGELRIKESDRLASLAANLSKMGAKVEELPDGLIIEGPNRLVGDKLDSCGDHRMAMSLSIAAMVASGETIISDADCVRISFPGFFDLLASLSNC